jgi:hypothetical protein
VSFPGPEFLRAPVFWWRSIRSGSWLCEKADVLRRRRIAFSSVTSPRLLARGPLSTLIDAEAQKRRKRRGFYASGARVMLPFMLPCVEHRVIWRACRNKVLMIFAPCTFLRNQGQARSLRPDPKDLLARQMTPFIPGSAAAAAEDRSVPESETACAVACANDAISVEARVGHD